MDTGYYNYIIPRWIQGSLTYSDYKFNAYAYLQLTECTYFDSFFIDLSQFGSLFGKDCTTYLMTDTQAFGYRSSYNAPIYSQILVQDRSILQAQWTLDSLDLILGLVGGFIALVWEWLSYILGGYESFKFSTALISEAYSTTHSSRMKKNSVPEDYSGAQSDLVKGLTTQAPYKYNYNEYLCSWVLLKGLCCFKSCMQKCQCYQRRSKRFARHEMAEE